MELTDRQKNSPWRKTFLSKEWQDAHKIKKKSFHFEVSDNKKGSYLNNLKIKR